MAQPCDFSFVAGWLQSITAVTVQIRNLEGIFVRALHLPWCASSIPRLLLLRAVLLFDVVLTACPASTRPHRRMARWVWRVPSLRRTQPRASSSGFSSTPISHQQVSWKALCGKMHVWGAFRNPCAHALSRRAM